MARQRTRIHRLFLRAVTSVAAVYGVIGAYVYQNYRMVGSIFMLVGGGALFGRQPTRRTTVFRRAAVPSNQGEADAQQSAA